MKQKQNKFLVYIISIIAATGGLLFGFDTGVISGAIPYIKDYWQLEDSGIEWIVTAVLIGALSGALLSGRLTDILGRKKVILITAIIFALGALATGSAPTPNILFAGRLVLGLAIGIASFTVPMYLAEISPYKIRGALVSFFQLMITIGILASYLSNLVIAEETNLESWRMMFYVGVFPAIVLLIGVLFLPESPRWLMSVGKEEKGEKILRKLEDPKLVEESIKRIKADIKFSEENKISWTEIFKPWLRSALIIGVGIMFIQQFVGINTVIYYAPTIFLISGFGGKVAALWATLSVGIVNVLFTILAVFTLDKLGRRKLYFIGLFGILIALISLGISFLMKDSLGGSLKWFSVGGVLVYILFFAISLGPLGWLLISEIYPLKFRGVAMSIGSFSNWFFNGIVVFTFLKLAWLFTDEGMEITMEDGKSGPNPGGAFLLYAAIAVVGIIWGYFYIPETKGVSLEKIEEHWRKGKKPREL